MSTEQCFREALARIASGFYTEKGAEQHAQYIIRLVDSELQNHAPLPSKDLLDRTMVFLGSFGGAYQGDVEAIRKLIATAKVQTERAELAERRLSEAHQEIGRLRAPETTVIPAGMDTPWPLHDVLAKLIKATEHLLDHHACDTQGHEEFRTAANRGKELLASQVKTSAPRAIERWDLTDGSEMRSSATIRHTGTWVRYDDIKHLLPAPDVNGDRNG